MLWHNVFTIYSKELLEVVRDKKTLIFMLLLPTLIFPLLMEMMVKFTMKAEKKAASESITYAIFGTEHLPELAKAFEDSSGFEIVEVASAEDIKTEIRNGNIKLGVIIPKGSGEKMAQGGQINVTLLHNNAQVTSKVDSRAKNLIEIFSIDQRDKRLAGIGVDSILARESLLEPVTVDVQGTASLREVIGATAGGFLPYLFVICCFLGALYPAIDLGAGEKERGTLETLLLAPVPRAHIVLGKFFVIATTGTASALFAIIGMSAWIMTKGQEVSGKLGEAIQTVSGVDLFLVAVMLIPIAALFAGLLLSISIYANSFKEAQSYATPFNFIIIIPAFLAMVPGIELNWGWAMVPITNISLAIKELIKGTMDYTMLVAILGSSTLLAGAMLVFCTQWFKREDVLFRQ